MARYTHPVHDFQFIQSYLLNKPTLAQSQMAARIATTTKSNDETIPGNLIGKLDIKKPSKYDKNLIIHYTHEARFASLKRDIHQLWNDILKNPIINDIKLIVGHRNNPKLTRDLMHLRAFDETTLANLQNGNTTASINNQFNPINSL